MTEEEIQQRLAAMRGNLDQSTQLAQQYGLAPQQASQWMQAYNQLANSGRFSGTLSDYFAQRSQGQVQAPTNQFPTPPAGLLDPPATGGGPTIPPGGDPGGQSPPGGPSIGGEPRDPRIPSIPNLGPPTGGGGPGGNVTPTGPLPNVQLPTGNGFNTDTLAAFGYMRGPNGEILPQMLRGGWSPYQAQEPSAPQQGFAPQGGQSLQLPQLGYNPDLEGFQWFTPPPVVNTPPATAPTTPTTPTLPPPTTGTGPGGYRGQPPRDSQAPKVGMLGAMGLPPALAGLLGR
jgi:hypothetical protein